MDIWFHATHAKCAAVFEMKMALYEAACDSLASASVRGGGGSDGVGRLIEKMQLTEPLRPPKTTGFLDEIEQQLHTVYGLLQDGYTLHDDDKVAFEGMKFAQAVAVDAATTAITSAAGAEPERDTRCNAELYGELTSTGVRQLHHTVLQCLKRAGVVVHTNMEECLQEGRGCEKSGEEEGNSRDRFRMHHHAIVAVDVGSGVGKLLFEWSLLARRDISRCCHCTWTHVGLELSPSRMSIARSAMRQTRPMLLLQQQPSPEDRRWVADPPHDDAVGARIVLGEADVFAEGLLTNDTFLPIAESMTLHGGRCDVSGDFNDTESPTGTSLHLVFFCCGLGFAEAAVRELCAALERMWLTPRDSSFASSVPPWQTLTCVLLLRPFPDLQTFPLFRLCTGEARRHNAGGAIPTRTHFETTWMSEAPAWVLSLRSCTAQAIDG